MYCGKYSSHNPTLPYPSLQERWNLVWCFKVKVTHFIILLCLCLCNIQDKCYLLFKKNTWDLTVMPPILYNDHPQIF